MSRVLLTLGATAILLDTFTTWAALNHQRFEEANATTAHLIRSLGEPAALTLTTAARLAIITGACLIAERFTRRRRLPILAILLVAVTIAWTIVVENILVLA